MRLKHVTISNFRLLADVVFAFEATTTVVVGRNNSGKTSLTELFRRLLEPKPPQFRFEDFALTSQEEFWQAFVAFSRGDPLDAVRALVPSIDVTLAIDYSDAPTNLGALSECVIDLNPSVSEAHLRVRYALRDGGLASLFAELPTVDESQPDASQRSALCRALRDRVSSHFEPLLLAIDPSDPTNTRELPWSTLRAIIGPGFINAQRGLDDVTHKDRAVLGRILEQLFATARAAAADPADKEIAHQLEAAVHGLQQSIEGDFNKQLRRLLPAFSIFGYPGLADPRLRTETTLDAERLLSNHTRVNYEGINGINLPESYNGLGSRNLIFILLSLLEFYKSHATNVAAPHIHLVFIEEPEVHLHPQMQEVFIDKLHSIGGQFAAAFGYEHTWPVQFVVTTHSSHIANRAEFPAIRYFMAKPAPSNAAIRQTTIKSLRDGLRRATDDSEFLHKYMTLTQCDLLFADKAILIEGPSERLLLPVMLRKLEEETPGAPSLSTQYLSVLEVGGAHAHLFLPLLEFLELPSLIITDLDSVRKQSSRYIKCMISEGERTSNECIKTWFAGETLTPAELLTKTPEAKTRGRTRLAYQIPQASGKPCGRSFEDAFILANPQLFGLTDPDEAQVWDFATTLDKTDFALDHAIRNTTWSCPLYIAEGLSWLASVSSDGAAPVPESPLPTPKFIAAAVIGADS